MTYKDIMQTYDIAISDIEFLHHDGKPLLARMYKPLGEGPFPAVVEVHGGAWTSGDRLVNEPIHLRLAASGVVVMAIDFRMPPEAQYPGSIQDINFAVRWLKQNAGHYAVDPAKIGGAGTSSGAHQIMLSALRPGDTRYCTHPLAGNVDASLAFILQCWAINDPLARYRMAETKGLDRLVAAHDAFWPDVVAMEDANPTLILERGEAKQLPPALLLQGTKDENMTPEMPERFVAAYRAAGGALEYHKFEGQPHAFVGIDPKAPDAVRALDLIVDFVQRHTA